MNRQNQLQVSAARWLMHHGFTGTGEGVTMYTKATGQRVRVKPGNEAQLRAELHRRFVAAFPGFRWKIPTAEDMAARWSPEGRARAARQQAEREARARLDVASVLGFLGG